MATKSKSKQPKLTIKQRIFIAEYLKDKNATRAAKAAGYSQKTAQAIAAENLSKPLIKREIEAQLNKIIASAQLTAADVLAEIRKLAFVDLSKAFAPDGTLLHPKEMPEDVRKALNTVETEELFLGKGFNRRKYSHTKKIKLTDKARMLEMLAKHFKLLTDVSEVTGKDGGPQVVFHTFANGSEAEES